MMSPLIGANMADLTLTVKPWSGRLTDADTYCRCCGKPKSYLAGWYVRVACQDGDQMTFAALTLAEITMDNWTELDTVGTACGKLLPLTHRISLKRLEKHLTRLES